MFRWLRRLLRWRPRRLGLYARIEGPRVLEHEARRLILAHVRANPCCTFAEVQRAVGLAHGTTKWHLDKIVRARMLKVSRDGRALRYASVEVGATEARGRAALRDPTRHAIARAVLMQPGVAQNELATRLGLAQSTIHHHCGRLVEEGLLSQRRAGRLVCYDPGPRLGRDSLL